MILPVRFRLVASGLMMEKVRSIAMVTSVSLLRVPAYTGAGRNPASRGPRTNPASSAARPR
jgi:hypothetical protein